MKAILLAVAIVLALVTPAHADRGGRCDGREGNCNDQQNNDSYGQCKYVCPTFDKSPVDHSFNPTICVMPGSCASQPPEDKKKEPQPATPNSLFPPNPAKIPQYVGQFFKLGVDFAQALVTGIVNPTIKFVEDLGTILA